MMFFRVMTLIVMVLAAIGTISEGGRSKWAYIGLFSSAGLLHLAAWTLSMTIY